MEDFPNRYNKASLIMLMAMMMFLGKLYKCQTAAIKLLASSFSLFPAEKSMSYILAL